MVRVLVIQLARLGDLIQTIPLLQSIKADAANNLTLLVDRRLASAARYSVPADRILSIDFSQLAHTINESDLPNGFKSVEAALSLLRQEQFDIVYNLNHSILNFAVLAQIRREIIVGFLPGNGITSIRCSPVFRVLFNQSHNRRYARVHLAEIFRLAAEKPTAPVFPLYRVKEYGKEFAKAVIKPLKEAGGKHIVTLHLGAGAEIRKWGAENFAYMVNNIRKKLDCGLIIVGTDKNESEDFFNFLSNKTSSVDLTLKTDVDQLAGVLAASDVVISSDSGPLQLAAAAGTKTVGLYFISAMVFETGPLGSGHLILQAEPECAPCEEDHPACTDLHCRQAISPKLAAEAAVRILSDSNLEAMPGREGVSVFRAGIDEMGQNYELISGSDEDKGHFYRKLWLRLLRGDIPAEDAECRGNWRDIPAVEKAVNILGMKQEYIPLAHHYYLSRADEGGLKAAEEFRRGMGILREMGMEPLNGGNL